MNPLSLKLNHKPVFIFGLRRQRQSKQGRVQQSLEPNKRPVSRTVTQTELGSVASAYLDFQHQGVDGFLQTLDLFAHLLLALLQAAHHLGEAAHPLLQVLDLHQAVDSETQEQSFQQGAHSTLNIC